MPRPRKLTEQQLAAVRRLSVQRRALLAALRALPTLEQLAEQWLISVSVLKQASAGRTYRDVPRESD
ncbi:MAG: hypothetical protein ACREUG_11665 [Steroidobacteraceae bacterium]